MSRTTGIDPTFRFGENPYSLQVHILLPPLLKLRTIVERLKAQSDIIGVRASKSGDLVLSLGTDNVKTDVSWTGLNNPTMGTFN